MRRAGLYATIAFALVCVAMVWVFAKGFGSDPREVPFMLAGKPAPAFSLQRIDTGEPVTLASFQGRPVVINFWATWCGPCKTEHPVLEWGARRFGNQAQFIGVVFEDTEENAKGYLARNGSGFPQMLDPNGRMAVDYGCAGVPETYFIRADGTILTKHVGPIDPQTLQERIQQLSQPSAAQTQTP